MSGRVINNLIEIRQGDSFVMNFQVKNKCQPADLTGATMLMQVRNPETNALMFSLAGTPVDAINGKMALLFTPTQTSIPVGDYITDIQITTADGNVNTIFPADVNKIGTFRITEQVTTGA